MECYKTQTRKKKKRFSASSELVSPSRLLSALMSPELELTSPSLCVSLFSSLEWVWDPILQPQREEGAGTQGMDFLVSFRAECHVAFTQQREDLIHVSSVLAQLFCFILRNEPKPFLCSMQESDTGCGFP